MLIGVKKRFVFVASSKTASTSIESVLVHYAEINRFGSTQRKHMTWKDARQEYAFLFNQPAYAPETFFRFGVIREPADWVRSWYNYRRRKPEGNKAIKNQIGDDVTFEAFWASSDWVKNVAQMNHFEDADGKCRFDLLIPMDDLTAAVPKLFSRLHVPEKALPKENSSPSLLKRSDLKPELINEINEYYKKDFENYSYWKKQHLTVLG